MPWYNPASWFLRRVAPVDAHDDDPHFSRRAADSSAVPMDDVDPFGGWATTGRGAELSGRRWLVTERCREYLMAAAQRFRGSPGFLRHVE